MKGIPHRHAVITGASSGIGLAIAETLLTSGVRVTALCRNPPPLNQSGATHIPVDLTDRAALESVLARLESDLPDLWINNAGFGLLGSLEKTPPERGEELLQLLLHIPIICSLWFARRLRESPPPSPYSACLVQVSSLACELPIPWMPYYNTAKAGLSGFADSLLLDRDLPCRVIDFRPGDFNTPFVAKPGMATDDPALLVYRETLDRHHAAAPPPKVAAASLARALRRKRSGIIRTGPFFQRAIAPLGVRFFPRKLLHAVIRRYYGQ
ncbi:MAG: SDR family oxidoreductase [Opitutales bacterium]|nr:SDR family oxidoreductase [Opitutales bacterium]